MFTSVRSNSCSAAISTRPAASRRAITSSGSVPRPRSRFSSSSQLGRGQEHQQRLRHGRRTCRAPCRSISSRVGTPAASFSSTGPPRRAVAVARELGPLQQLARGDEPVELRRRRRRSSAPRGPHRAGVFLVVTETDSHTSGCARRSSATTVDLPTPDGPERTVRPPVDSRGGEPLRLDGMPRSGLASRALTDSPDQDVSVTSYPPLNPRCVFLCEPRLALGCRRTHARGQARWLAPRPRTRRDSAMPSRSMICLARTLPTPGSDSRQSRHLHLADDVVGLPILEHLSQRNRAVLEPVLDLGTLFAGLGSLLQGCGALLRGKGRKSHAGSPRISCRCTRTGRETSWSSAPKQRQEQFLSPQNPLHRSP